MWFELDILMVLVYVKLEFEQRAYELKRKVVNKAFESEQSIPIKTEIL